MWHVWIHGQVKNPIYEIAKENNLVYDGFEKLLFENLTLDETRNISISKDQLINSNFLQGNHFFSFLC